MALAIGSNKHHAHTHTHTHPSSHETRGNQSVVLPPAKPLSLLHTAPHQHLSQPSRHLSTTATSTSASLWDACCRVPQRGSLCAEKDAFLRRRAIVVRVYCHTHTHTHTHIHHSHRRLPERELVLLCLCETTIVSPSYTSRHGIHHIIINDIYIYIEREREGGSARGGC